MPRPDGLLSLGLSLTNFQKGFNEALAEIEKFEKKTGKIAPNSVKWAAGLENGFRKIAAAIGLIGIAKFTTDVIAWGENLKIVSREAGVTTETLQRLQAALKSKLSAEDTSAALVHLNELLREARHGSAAAQEQLSKIGATASDTADSALLKYADKMQELGASTRATDISAKVFGNTLGSKLRPAVMQGSDAIKTLGDSAAIADEKIVKLAERGGKALKSWADTAKRWALTGAGMVKEGGDMIGDILFGNKLEFSGDDRGNEEAKASEEKEKALRNEIQLIDVLIRNNERRALRVSGALEEEKTLLDEISALMVEQSVLARDAPDEKKRLSELSAEIRAKTLALDISEQQRKEEERSMQNAIDETKLRQAGQIVIADQLAITAKYENDILKALREQNTEKADLLTKQRELDRKAQNAAQKRKTPREKANERREARALARDAKKQEARDAENLRRAGESGDRLGSDYSIDRGAPVKDSSRPIEGGVNGKSGFMAPRGTQSRLIDESLAKQSMLIAEQQKEAQAREHKQNMEQKQAEAYNNLQTITNEIKAK